RVVIDTLAGVDHERARGGPLGDALDERGDGRVELVALGADARRGATDLELTRGVGVGGRPGEGLRPSLEHLRGGAHDADRARRVDEVEDDERVPWQFLDLHAEESGPERRVVRTAGTDR